MGVTSEEINYLIYRYLVENGFHHSAFMFSNESFVSRNNVTGAHVPTGALISFLQKGLEYIEIDAHINEDGTDIECQQPFSLTMPHQCDAKLKKDKDIFRREKREKKERELRAAEKEFRQQNGKEPKRPKQEALVSDTALLPNTSILPPLSRHESFSGEVIVDDSAPSPLAPPSTASAMAPLSATPTSSIAPMSRIIQLPATAETSVVPSSEVHVYSGHNEDVNICAWHPRETHLLASGSADGTVRVWNALESTHHAVMCYDTTSDSTSNSRDVTSIEWNMDGSLLATGAYDGILRVFEVNGTLRHSLHHHRGPIFVTKWHADGNYLLSGGVDKSMIAWDMQSGTVKQVFNFHSAPVLNLDWRPHSNLFASCGADHMIYIASMDVPSPLKIFAGHRDEVNGIKWDPTGRLVASCSDDGTAKLWSIDSEKYLYEMTHAREAYSLHWHPKEPSFATACFDNHVYLWSSNTGQCLGQLSKHSRPVYALAYSPDGQYLASGSFDQTVHIWSVKDQRVVKSFVGQQGVLDISWNPAGQSIAATMGDKVYVLDVRM